MCWALLSLPYALRDLTKFSHLCDHTQIHQIIFLCIIFAPIKVTERHMSTRAPLYIHTCVLRPTVHVPAGQRPTVISAHKHPLRLTITAMESSLELFAYTFSSLVEHKLLTGKGHVLIVLFPWALNRAHHSHEVAR